MGYLNYELYMELLEKYLEAEEDLNGIEPSQEALESACAEGILQARTAAVAHLRTPDYPPILRFRKECETSELHNPDHTSRNDLKETRDKRRQNLEEYVLSCLIPLRVVQCYDPIFNIGHAPYSARVELADFGRSTDQSRHALDLLGQISYSLEEKCFFWPTFTGADSFEFPYEIPEGDIDSKPRAKLCIGRTGDIQYLDNKYSSGPRRYFPLEDWDSAVELFQRFAEDAQNAGFDIQIDYYFETVGISE